MGLEDILGSIGDFFTGGPGAEAAGAVGDVAAAAGPGLSEAAQGIGETGMGAGSPGELFDVGKLFAGGGGGGSWMPNLDGSKVWEGVKGGWQDAAKLGKEALPFAQLGTAGLGAWSGVNAAKQASEQQKIQRHAQQLQEQAAVPLTNFGQSQIKAAQAGQVPQAVEAQIQQWKQGAMQQVRDLFARMGIPTGTSETSAEQLVEQQAVAMRANWLQSEAQQGVGALSAATGAAGQMSQTAEHQQNSLDALIGSANQALARLAAGAAA